MNLGIANDGIARNDLRAVNRWPFISSMWLERYYINPFSNASDIGKIMKPQGFGNKSKSDDDNMIDTIIEYIEYIPSCAYCVAEKSLYQSLQ
jgi:long-subunit fatty acid transport protein